MKEKITKVSDISEFRKEALKYKTKTEFHKNNKKIYKKCFKLGIINEICSHMKHGNWTTSDEELFIIAKQFKHRGEFKTAYPSKYKMARERGILNEVCAHMELSGNKFKRKIYAFEHSDNTVYVGLSYNPALRKIAHLSKNKILIEKSKTTIQTFKILTDWLDKDCAAKQEGEIIKLYLKNGWNILNKAKAGALGGMELKWTKEKCAEIAKKCKTRTEFYNKNSSAYRSANNHGWSDEICSHMGEPINKMWTYEELQQEALKYSYRYEFKKNNKGAYKAARQRSILNQICLHMPKDKRFIKEIK